jgi:hypothetical protein
MNIGVAKHEIRSFSGTGHAFQGVVRQLAQPGNGRNIGG